MHDQIEHQLPGGADTTALELVHRALRREFELLPELVAAVAPHDLGRARVVAGHASGLIASLRRHRSTIDGELWPGLCAHAPAELEVAPLAAALTERQAFLGELLAETERLLALWRADATLPARTVLLTVLASLGRALDGMLRQVEDHLMPLVAEQLAPAELARFGRRSVAGLPRGLRPIFLGHVLAEATPDERRRYLSRLPVTGRLGFRLHGARRFRRELESVRATLLADPDWFDAFFAAA